MLTPTTLSAFSSGVSQTGFGQADLLQRVRAAASQQSPPAFSAPAPSSPSVPAPGQKLPRGSLLDLSV
ncbi:MAG TPA: hypothetical protein VL614_26810 [Acetobacteraceae bacterium]|nr:hypothetical protein [Acetobacteraceae bacterium]